MTTKVLSAIVTEDAIRARAYQIWEEEGRPEGEHELHWRRAMEWLSSQAPASVKAESRAKASKSKTSQKKR
jgi:hypothetical protein